MEAASVQLRISLDLWICRSLPLICTDLPALSLQIHGFRLDLPALSLQIHGFWLDLPGSVGSVCWYGEFSLGQCFGKEVGRRLNLVRMWRTRMERSLM